MKLISTTFLLLCFVGSYAQSYVQWRGANRDGIYNESKLLKTWQESGPTLLWATEEIGNGYGSPVITSDKVLINGEIDSISHLFAFDFKGKLLWKIPNGKEFVGQGFSQKFPGSRSAPTVVNDLIYICSGIGRIACIENNTRTEKWSVDMISDLHGLSNYFGYSESLLIDGDNLFCYPGGKDTNVVALDRFTGKVKWVSKALSDTVSFCSPLIIKLPQRDVLVTFSSYYFFGLDAKTGELLWSQKQENVKNKQQCNTPIYADGYLYYLAGDGNGIVKLEISPDGKTMKEVWRNNTVKNNFQGFVKIGNYFYCPDVTQKLKSVDAATGQVSDTVKVNRGAIIAADNMLYVYAISGDMNLVKYDGAKMEVTSKFKVDKGTNEHFAHPVIDKGVLYIRHGKALMAYDIQAK